MPRLLFSSLPADLTTAELTQILSNPPKGISAPSSLDFANPRPTDVKVLFNRLGRSRRMAFVGYKSESQAAWIKDVWQGVWIDGRSKAGSGSQISVEWAKTVQDCTKDRGLIQTNDTNTLSSIKPLKKKLKIDDSLQKPQDPQFAEFLTLSNPRKNKSLVHEIVESSVPTLPQELLHSSTKERTVSYSQQKQQDILTDPHTEKIESSRRSPSIPPVIGDDDDVTDKEYLANRMKRQIINPEERNTEDKSSLSETKEWDQDPVEAIDQNQSHQKPQEIPINLTVPSDEACILETSRLFLRNLAFSVTEEELLELFQPFGNIAQVHILLDGERKPKGLGYVTFTKASDALEAYRQLDQTDFQGRLLHLLPAVTRNPRVKPSDSDSKGRNIVKQDQDSKRRLESSKQFNWAALYMNSDAVASSVADRLNITKSELFDPEAQNPAVKLALAETHVINETKEFMEKNGINIGAFEKLKSARSETTLLVKNIPYKTSTNVIKALFSEHGTVIKVLMPPSGTIAVVEMADKDDAKSAFRGLSYKRIGNSVLYLERAPHDLWQINLNSSRNEEEAKTGDSSVVNVLKEEETGEPGSTIFVKNISFETTPEALASRFSNQTDYLFSRIQTKPDPKNPGHRLSMGFGFIGFRTVDSAKQAIQKMQGCYLDGHTLELKFAKRGREDDEEEDSNKLTSKTTKGSTNKLLVKNLPFEVNKKELYELFGVYGKLKSIRLPKKIDRKSRGFAFVEYHTKKEAQEAMKSLKFSHILGRHLVIEYANESSAEFDLDKLRNSQTSFLNSRNAHQKKKFVGLENCDDDLDDTLEGNDD